MPLRDWAGAATRTKLTAAITGTPATFTVVDATGWPTGSTASFVTTIDRGKSTEEKILCTRSGTTFTVVTRGHDGTSSVDHSNGADVEHTLDAASMAEFSQHVNLVADPHPQYHLESVHGNSGDPHTQYLDNARHDVTARHTFGAALGTPGTPAAVGAAGAAGAGVVPARSDHVHAGLVRVGCSLSMADQSFNDNAQSNIVWTTEVSDPQGFITVPHSKVVVPAGLGGVYGITLEVIAEEPLDMSQISFAAMYVGPSVSLLHVSTQAVDASLPIGVSCTVPMNPGDEVSCVGQFQVTSSPVLVNARFHMYRVSL